MPSDAFQALFEQHVAASLEKQHALSDYLGEHRWQADLESGQLDFGSGRVFPLQLLGSEDSTVGTWLWGWANASVRQANPTIFQAGVQLRQYGQQQAIPELTTEEIDLNDHMDGQRLALVAAALFPADFYYRGAFSGGAAFFLVTGSPIAPLPPAEVSRLITIITQVISTYSLDHLRMIQAYLTQRGFTLTGNQWQHADGRSLTVQFDDVGRLASISSTEKPTP